MNRGSQQLTRFFPLAYETADPRKKGAASMGRDRCLTYRFFYYYHIVEKRFDVAISDMEREFFIGSRTILDRLIENDDLLKQIVTENPNRRQLKKLYPHLDWN